MNLFLSRLSSKQIKKLSPLNISIGRVYFQPWERFLTWRMLQGVGRALCITRSLGALRAPTSSRRSFGPLDFVLRAHWALRPCDPRGVPWAWRSSRTRTGVLWGWDLITLPKLEGWLGQCQKLKTLYYPFSYANLANFLASRDIYHMYLLHLLREHLKVGTTSCLRFQSMGTPWWWSLFNSARLISACLPARANLASLSSQFSQCI